MKISKNKMVISLDDDLKKCETYIEKPIIIFRISDFLDAESYQNLVDEIYLLSDFHNPFMGKGEKKIKNINGSNINEINVGSIKDFCEIILSNEFYLWFKKTHLKHFKSHLLKFKVEKPRSLRWRIFNKLNKYIKLPISSYYAEIEFSSIKAGDFIPPHTDNKNKRLSMVYYIPSRNEVLNEQMKESLGTLFWKAREEVVAPLKRFNCGLLEGSEREVFYNDYEPLFTSKYESNCVTGFIKSDISWHTVEKFQFNYDRRAIVINIYEFES